MLTLVIWLTAKSERVDTGTTFGAGSNTPGLANDFVLKTVEYNAGAEMTGVSTSGLS